MMDKNKGSKGQQTREQLIEAAFRQFTQQGFHGASMRQIANGAGLALGGIYNHFASKDEIFKAVALAYHPLNLLLPTFSEAQGQNAEALVRDAIQRFYTVLKQRPEFLNILFIELVECQGRHLPELMMALLPKVMALANQLAAFQEALQPIPPVVMVRILMGNLFGFFLTETMFSRLAGQITGQEAGQTSGQTTSQEHLPNPLQQLMKQVEIGDLETFTTILLHGLLRRQSS